MFKTDKYFFKSNNQILNVKKLINNLSFKKINNNY